MGYLFDRGMRACGGMAVALLAVAAFSEVGAMLAAENAFALEGADLAPAPVSASGKVDADTDTGYSDREPRRATWIRLAGDDAFGTMKAITSNAQGWKDGSCESVVLATSSGYWDALAASALAGAEGRCPVLLTSPTELPEQTASEIRRLDVDRVVICGGEAAISAEVEKAVRDLNVATERVQGSDAQQTAVQIAKRVRKVAGSIANKCVVATSAGYYDALSIAPSAFSNIAPVYLTDDKGNLGEAALADMKDAGYEYVIIVGGTAAVSESTEHALESTMGIDEKDIFRLAGDNAWQTSAKIAEFWIDIDHHYAECLALADGNGYWDALTGAAFVGKAFGTLLLVPHDGPNSEGGVFSYDPFVIDEVIKKNSGYISQGLVFGGGAAVPESTMDAARKATSE